MLKAACSSSVDGGSLHLTGRLDGLKSGFRTNKGGPISLQKTKRISRNRQPIVVITGREM
jgi:hypothetical protein